jgi:hypothetical protein
LSVSTNLLGTAADHLRRFQNAVEALVASSGLSPSRLDSIRRNRKPYTELRDADRLLAAMNRTDALSDGKRIDPDGTNFFNLGGTLELMPNPKASKSTLESLTGALGPQS